MTTPPPTLAVGGWNKLGGEKGGGVWSPSVPFIPPLQCVYSCGGGKSAGCTPEFSVMWGKPQRSDKDFSFGPEQTSARTERGATRLDSISSLFLWWMNIVFVCISLTYLLRRQPTVFLDAFHSPNTHTHPDTHAHRILPPFSFSLQLLRELFITKEIAAPAHHFCFLNEKRWYRQALSYTDTAATERAGEDEEEKALGAINKLVMRAQSRMVMWWEITCCEREKGERETVRRYTEAGGRYQAYHNLHDICRGKKNMCIHTCVCMRSTADT